MRSGIMVLIFMFTVNVTYSQVRDTGMIKKSLMTDHRIQENSISREDRNINPEMIPSVIIILNYKKVISMKEYQTVKGNKDIIKEYFINSGNNEAVEKIIILESKNKEKYKDFGQR